MLKKLCLCLAAVLAMVISVTGCGKKDAGVNAKLVTSQQTINDVYDVKLDYRNFNLFKWLTGYYELKECAKYYDWE